MSASSKNPEVFKYRRPICRLNFSAGICVVTILCLSCTDSLCLPLRLIIEASQKRISKECSFVRGQFHGLLFQNRLIHDQIIQEWRLKASHEKPRGI